MRVASSGRFRLTPIAALVGSSCFALNAMAQQAPAPAAAASAAKAAEATQQLDAVNVTARRRLETQFDVPGPVTAVQGEGLRARGITSISDVISLVPNAVVPDDPQSFNTYINIRGIRQADAQAEPNFGLYRNGIYDGGHRTNLGSQVDVDRIEVLRGPQGGLYGRNAVGGAVDLVYKMPQLGDTYSGYATFSLENHQRTRAEGAVTAPLNDKLVTRTTVWNIEQRKGEYYNQTLDEQIDRSRDKGIRFSTAFGATEALSFLWSLEYQKTSGPSQRAYAPNGVANGFATSPPETIDTVRRDTPSRSDTEQFYATQKLMYSTLAGDLTLLAAYRDYKLKGIEDQDFTALSPSAAPAVLQQVAHRDEKVRNYYLEALWASPENKPFTWRVGASYFHETFDFSRVYNTAIDLSLIGVAPFVLNGQAGIPEPGSSMGTRSTSVFGDIRYEITPTLAATASLRWTHDSESLHYAQAIDPSGDPTVDGIAAALFGTAVPTYALDTTRSFHFTSPAVGLEYKLTKDANVYASYSTGYRPGGFNTTSTSPQYIPYNQESARNLEAGIKTRWLDGQAGVNLTVFRMDQKDLVLSQDDPNGGQFFFTYLANVGRARTYGEELEAFARVTPWLTAAASVGHLHARFTAGASNPGTESEVDYTGSEVPYTRDWTLNARLDATKAINDKLVALGSIGVRREIGGQIGGQGLTRYDNLTKLDMSAGLKIGNNWQVGTFILNATNQRVAQFIFNNGAIATNRGRTYGMQGTYRF